MVNEIKYQNNKLTGTDVPVTEKSEPIGFGTLENIKVEDEIFDTLMNLTGELVLIKNRFAQISSKSNDSEITNASLNLSLITSEIQERLMKTGKVTSLSIIPALVVEASGKKIAIPQKNLVELVSIDSGEVNKTIEKIGEAEFYRLRGEILPLIRLSDVLNLKQNEADIKSINIVVLLEAGIHFGLIVERVIDSEDIVLKPLNKVIKHDGVFSGATILGDGGIAFVLNISKITGKVNLLHLEEETSGTSDQESIESLSGEIQSLLLFSIAENERFAVPLSLVSRLEKIAPENIEIVGGKEIIRYRGSSMPIIKLENFLGILPPDYGEEATIIVFELENQNIGFYTSKIIDAIEVNIKIDKDTFERKGLLGSSIIREKVTLLLDVYSIIEMYDPTWFAHKRISSKKTGKEFKAKLLLVEDSQFWRSMEKSYLESEGYSLTIAENGEAGLEKLKSAQFDLVITDLEMPIMDGFELTRRIRNDEKLKNIPVIAVTALIDELDKKKAVDSGIDEYLLKLDKNALLETIDRILEKISS